ncbi:hypothetical protein SAMN02745164_00514 [Marinitoga hydrogenitolerans DSM 16785]|uniref:Uncharacterized protein n=1 Tax=Marinitoga hydrogenitolerans (strain DSM 16785 / JCM 12826 / AT1271) TaxID=1122195 RepID=A0A1M4TUZ9_MARH1|nr:phage tail tube protein [Marinitoga hydrogenitolerans]SHE48137.1 hypothetical protein SAMN02745164_00514 [Marinitoga hydrogenitolerans DSM 16785]
MAYTGAKSSVLLGIESSFATEATVKYKLPFKSESINHKIETAKSEALLGIRGTKSLVPTKEGAEGSLELEAYPTASGLAFYLALGKSVLMDPDSTPSSGDEYTKITPIDLTADIPSATVQVDHFGQKMKYLGMKVNSLKFSGAVGSIPSISLDLVGKEEVIGAATQGTIVDVDPQPFFFKELILYTDEFVTPTDLYSSIELNIANNLDTDDYRLDGTGKRKTLEAGNLEITGSLDIIFDASVISGEYTKFKNFQDAQLGIKLEKTTGEKLEIFLPRVNFSEMTHDISGAEKIMIKANFTALIPTSGDIIVISDYQNTTGTY